MPQLSLISLLRSKHMFVRDCWKSVFAHPINTPSPIDPKCNSSFPFHKSAPHLYFQSHLVKPSSSRFFSYETWVILNSFFHSWIASILIPIDSRSKMSNIINTKMGFSNYNSQTLITIQFRLYCTTRVIFLKPACNYFNQSCPLTDSFSFPADSIFVLLSLVSFLSPSDLFFKVQL